MRILMVHNRYQQRGGEDVSYEADVALLREHGHTVYTYEESNHRIKDISALRAFFRASWSRESYNKTVNLIQSHRPDIVHIHNFFPLISPAVHYAAMKQDVPVVQALRNYRLVCPNALLLRDGKVCEDCLGKPFPWPGILYACYRNSRLATTAVATMIATHRALRTWQKHAVCFIALTEFSRQKYIEGGLPADRIVVRPNFIPSPIETKEKVKRTGGIFVGMLHPWKGADVLLEAWRNCADADSLIIVGDGPEKEKLYNIADERVRFTGQLGRPDINSLLSKALFLVFPSIWYETFGRTIIEAFACGTPVIASRLGAAAELVKDGKTGLLFSPGDARELADKIHWAFANPDTMQRMGKAARRDYELKYTPEAAYQSLEKIYHEAIETRP